MRENNRIKHLPPCPQPSEDEREDAYDTLWLPMESRHGDGDPAVLGAFLERFVTAAEV